MDAGGASTTATGRPTGLSDPTGHLPACRPTYGEARPGSVPLKRKLIVAMPGAMTVRPS